MNSDRTAGLFGAIKHAPLAMGTLSTHVTDPLPTAPDRCDYTRDVPDYPMALNDRLGCCTIAGAFHLAQVQYAEVGQTLAYPGDDVIQSTYFGLTGGADDGLQLPDVLKAWMTDGLFGTKIVGFAPVDVANADEMASVIYCFGGVYLGVECPDDMQKQFEADRTWTVNDPADPDPAIVGGHCIIGTGYDTEAIEVVTWGETDRMTLPWWRKYAMGAFIVIPEVFVDVKHGPLQNIDLATLQADAQALL